MDFGIYKKLGFLGSWVLDGFCSNLNYVELSEF